MRTLPLILLLNVLVGCSSGIDQGKSVDDQAQEAPEQHAEPDAVSGINLRLHEIDKSKRSPGKTAIDVFVVNQSKEPITVYRAPGLPHIYLAVQIKQPNGKVYRLIDAYPTMDIALFDDNFVEVAPGKELKLCSYESELVRKIGETWVDDRGKGTSRLSFEAKGQYQLWFAYGGGSPFAYSKVGKGEFADLKHGTQFGPATIEVELK
ncbi:MAG: hypothetical protein CMJ64_19805 [Planctomycetaceae bacterium]|nr:hypothetical protein [Planctomycetaceae bacterium]